MIQRWAHIFLAFIVLFASSGIVLTKHFCQNEFKAYSIYMPATTCNGSSATSCYGDIESGTCCSSSSVAACCSSKKPASEQDGIPCCTNESNFLKLDEDLQTFSLSVPIDITVVFLGFAESSYQYHFKSRGSLPINDNYHPPPIVRDITVLQQSFLC